MAASPTTLTMSVEEYLNTTFRPDVDFVDGVIEERNAGEWDHGRLQGALVRIFGDHEEEWDIYVAPEIRTQTARTRYRVPDVCVVDGRFEEEQIVRRPPVLCIEVVSPADRLPRVFDRIKDFHRMGVGVVWVFDPATRQVWVSTPDEVTEHMGGELYVPDTKIVIDPEEVFRRAARRG